VFGKVRPYGGDRDVYRLQYPPCRDPKRADPTFRHPGVPHRVTFGLVAHVVGAAVNLDRQARRAAEEIEDVGTHRMLSAESQTVELRASEG
jgi:hypothetical protein